MDLENTTLSEVREKKRQILYDSIHMWNLKNYTNQSMYKTETDAQMKKTNLRVTKRKSSVQFSRSVVSDSLQPHESQHARQGKGKGANDK